MVITADSDSANLGSNPGGTWTYHSFTIVEVTPPLSLPLFIHTKETNFDILRYLRQCRGGLVGYDAALTQLRSWVQFPFLVLLFTKLVLTAVRPTNTVGMHFRIDLNW